MSRVLFKGLPHADDRHVNAHRHRGAQPKAGWRTLRVFGGRSVMRKKRYENINSNTLAPMKVILKHGHDYLISLLLILATTMLSSFPVFGVSYMSQDSQTGSRLYYDPSIMMSGLSAEYFILPGGISRLSEIDFTAAPDATAVVDGLDHATSDTPFWQGGPADQFAARYTGALVVETAGRYTLRLTSDDGSALYLDGVPVIDNDGLHAAVTREVTLDLEAGMHPLELLYFERSGVQTLELEWQGPDTGNLPLVVNGASLAHEAMPAAASDPVPAAATASENLGLAAEYFILPAGVSTLSDIDFAADPDATAVVGALDMVKSYTPFWQDGPADNFAARYTGALVVETAGRYTLYLTSDDGSALYLDGARVIDNDGLHGNVTRQVTLDLSAGRHALEVLYFERTGHQTLELDWQGPDTGGIRRTIDGTALEYEGAAVEPDAATRLSIAGQSYDLLDQDVARQGTALHTLTADGAGVTLTDNGWKAVEGNFEITEDTVLSFTFSADVIGEIHGIGFANGDRLANKTFFQLAGTQSWGLEGGDWQYVPGSGEVAVHIEVGKYFTGTFDRLVLGMDDDEEVGADSTFADIDIGLTASDPDVGTQLVIAGQSYELLDHAAGQQGTALHTLTADSAGVTLTDNGWKAVQGNFEVTEDTVLSFTFSADVIGEIHGIGFANGDSVQPGTFFQLAGTQSWGLEGGDWQYVPGAGEVAVHIEVGKYFTGTFDRLVLGMDDDEEVGADSTFADIDIGVMAPPHDHDHGHEHHPEDNPHEPGSTKHAEHAAVFDLVQHKDATHVAVRDGSWFDPDTWAGGMVPGDDARVVIASGVVVDYDDVSDARLFTVRVDGSLNVATDTDTRMIVDTMVVDMKGTLTIGTADNPVQGDVRADIVIANNGGIDIDWDPQLLSRGIVSHGTVDIHGQEKTSDLKVATDPMAGDSTLTLAEAPLNWQVGDTIVIAGTRYDGYKWDNDIRAVRHHEPEDEVRTITAIEGNIIHLDRVLEHDHDTSRADLKTSVANYSRNVTIGTEDPETAAVHERGHVMFMHSGDVDVRYAAFHELGRTDKSRDAIPASIVEDVASDTNVQGRYSFHFHRSGIDDVENPAMAVGNAVFGSPGWGFVHHDSHAVLHDNATYNTFGAGFVAETGNETGSWSDNIAIYAQGASWEAPKNGNNTNDPNFDLGRTGDGFWFQGRMVESIDNIAASVNTGFVYIHRGKGMLPFDSAAFDFPEALGLRKAVSPDNAPILSFRGNEAFAAKEGLHVVKNNPNQGHDIHSHLQDFTAWSVISGAHLEYTSHYLLENFDVVGKEATSFSRARDGISLGTNVSDITIISARIDGFSEGINASKSFTSHINPDTIDIGISVIDANILNTVTPFKGLNEAVDLRDPDTLVPDRFEIRLDAPLTYKEGWPDPDARKVAISVIKIDSLGEVALPAGSDSYDIGYDAVINILETSGFFEAENGKKYFVVEAYYSDRGTGEIHKFGHLVEIDPNVPLQNPHSPYKNAVFAGQIDLDSLAPVTGDETAKTAQGADLVIDLLANDYDPDGDAIAIDGIVQPQNGIVFDNKDGTVTYRPDLGFTGTDTFKYWVTDGFGNFTPSHSTIEVTSVASHGAAIDSQGTDIGVPPEGQSPAPPVGVPDTEETSDASTVTKIETALAQSVAEYRHQGLTVVQADDGNTEIWADTEGSVLVGSESSNRLHESRGSDVMYGGAGEDQFIWDLRRDSAEHDIILDLNFAEGDALGIVENSGNSWLLSDAALASAITSGQIEARQTDAGVLELWTPTAPERILELASYDHFEFV
jgi:hypothetical protein